MPYVSTVAAADELEGDYPDLCPTRPNAASLRSTADYHRSLLEERHDSASFGSRRKQDLPGSSLEDNEPAVLCSKSWKTSKREKTQQEAAAAKFRHPELTQQDLEEFESLPLAIRRKVSIVYFIPIQIFLPLLPFFPSPIQATADSGLVLKNHWMGPKEKHRAFVL